MSKLVAEALGTFTLCFIGAGSICTATMVGAGYAGLLGVAIAHGLALSIAVSATMNVSGGHVNPAVTAAMLITGRIKVSGAAQYVVAQLIGGVIAGLLVLAIFDGMTAGGGETAASVVKVLQVGVQIGESGGGETAASVVKEAGLGTPFYDAAKLSMGKAILVEGALTFLLVFAVFGTAVDPRAPKLGGFAIGLTIAMDILLGGPLTGAAMNPARTFGPGIVAAASGNLKVFWSQHVVYWVGPILGGILAGLVYEKLILARQQDA
jgi:MIP family channel proteins